MDILGQFYLGFYLSVLDNVKDYYTDDLDIYTDPDDPDNVYYVTKHYYNVYTNVKDSAKIEDIVNTNPLYFTDKFKLLDVNDITLIDT